jgi:hypothetical protein
MEHTDILDRNWRDCELSKPLYPTLVFTRDGLAGGRAHFLQISGKRLGVMNSTRLGAFSLRAKKPALIPY